MDPSAGNFDSSIFTHLDIVISASASVKSNPFSYRANSFDINLCLTISFTVKDKTSKEVSNILVNNKIATRNDNFYAWRCLKALGIDTKDGVVRISLAHYNTLTETQYLIKILELV